MTVVLEVDVSGELGRLRLPAAVARRLQSLLDRQDQGETLSAEERAEAEGLVELADLLGLLRVRGERRLEEQKAAGVAGEQPRDMERVREAVAGLRALQEKIGGEGESAEVALGEWKSAVSEGRR